jgi:hypothetical protein
LALTGVTACPRPTAPRTPSRMRSN